jgi:hypothetical protein
MRTATILLFLFFIPAGAQIKLAGCACDVSKPETLDARQCALCREAEKQPPDVKVFFLKDANPMKANRWLALPRKHTPGAHLLSEMTPQERTELWTAAIEKAKSLWGEDWGVAINGDEVRTQCHTHIHIGKLIKGADIETDNFVVVSGPAQIPVPVNEGFWIHPAGNKLHVHKGEQRTETVLFR